MTFGPSYQYKATVTRVIDGDTLAVRVDLGFRIYHDIHVRVRDIDCPELRSSDSNERLHAQLAKEYVETLLCPPGTEVVLVTAKAAVYNRWEAHVYLMLTPGVQVSLADLLRDRGFTT